jgi:hypothetical protein
MGRSARTVLWLAGAALVAACTGGALAADRRSVLGSPALESPGAAAAPIAAPRRDPAYWSAAPSPVPTRPPAS